MRLTLVGKQVAFLCDGHSLGDWNIGLARNKQLERMIAGERAEAKAAFQAMGKPARQFNDLTYRTRKSWSRSRCVVAKSEHLEKGANPRFAVT